MGDSYISLCVQTLDEKCIPQQKCSMTTCSKCKGNKSPFTRNSKVEEGYIECVDCHSMCRNSYFEILRHIIKCAKRETNSICVCNGHVETTISKRLLLKFNNDVSVHI